MATFGALVIGAVLVLGAWAAFGRDRTGPIEPFFLSPRGDLYVRLTPQSSMFDGSAGLRSYGPQGDGLTIVDESVVRIASVESAAGAAELFTWTAESADGSDIFDCAGDFLDYSDDQLTSSNCHPAGSVTWRDDPSLSFTRGSAAEGPSMVSATNTPVNASWMVVTTAEGVRIVANVEGKASHVSWTSTATAEPVSVVFLDVERNELWAG